MIKTLKKQWFVVLIAIIFIGFAVFCIYDTNKGKLPGKSSDGKDVIASLNDKTNYTADDVYKKLYESNGKNLVYLRFQAALIDESVKTTDELKKAAAQYAENFSASVTSQATSSGQSGTDPVATQLANYGFAADELDYYAMVIAKMTELQNGYIEKHFDELFAPMYKNKNPRSVSHILIKMEDAKKPTDAEMKKVKEVEAALEKGTSFEEIAKKYSDDGSATNGGYLGYMDKDTQYVDSFKNKALSMKKGEVSSWVKESGDSYNGWHIIKVNETEQAALKKDTKIKDSLYLAIGNANVSIANKYLAEAMKKVDIKYANDTVKKEIMDTLEIKE